jgi:maltooligosyltrehalose trehalohydrolase
MTSISKFDGTALKVGAFPTEEGTTFTVWAPRNSDVMLHLLDQSAESDAIKMEPRSDGYFTTTRADIVEGARYRYGLSSGQEWADPASRSQPDGHLGPSQVVDLHAYEWRDDAYRPLDFAEHVISESHVGTFTPGGTFDDAIRDLSALADIGISAVELMPVAEFPGARNWGYDGVFPFAVQHSYGGWSGLQRFVDECHQRNLAVILDVVYNHIGPEGNVFDAYGPYFTDRYQTPWGPAINFDGPASDHVRAFFLQNARQWFADFHIDALRLDAVHEIIDRTATPFLTQLSRVTHAVAEDRGRALFLVAESPDNDPRLVIAEEDHGIGLHAVWNDDFHHALHVAATGERSGYYADYTGANDLRTAVAEGFVYQGQFSPFRQRHHGAAPRGVPPKRFINFAQNHDQIGNRPGGDRLVTMVSPEVSRLVAATLLLSPGLPLLFMGEEYGESAPFPYFVDHHDPALLQAVREGRANEFASLADAGQLFDPGASSSYAAAKLDRPRDPIGLQRITISLYTALIRLRRQHAALGTSSLTATVAESDDGLLTVHRSHPAEEAVVLLNFTDRERLVHLPVPNSSGDWRMLISSSSASFDAAGLPNHDSPSNSDATVSLQPWGFAAYQQNRDPKERQ